MLRERRGARLYSDRFHGRGRRLRASRWCCTAAEFARARTAAPEPAACSPVGGRRRRTARCDGPRPRRDGRVRRRAGRARRADRHGPHGRRAGRPRRGAAARRRSCCAGSRPQRWPLGNMYEFTSAICSPRSSPGWWCCSRGTGAAARSALFVLFPVVILLFLGGTVLYTQAAPGGARRCSRTGWSCTSPRSASSSGLFFVPGHRELLFLLRPVRPAARRAGREGCRRPRRWTGWPTASRSSPSRSTRSPSSRGRSGRRRRGAGSGAGTRRRRSRSSPGSSTRPTCTPARPRAGAAAAPRGSTSLGLAAVRLQPVLHQHGRRGPPLVRRGELRRRTRPRLDRRVVAPLPSASRKGWAVCVWGAAGWIDDGA